MIKRLLTTLLLALLVCFVQARIVYVSAAGNNAANGLTTGTAWQTIAKVNTSSLAGDTVRFRRGDTFSGGIVAPGNGMYYEAYGVGADPIISGYSTVTGWTLTATPNVWKASYTGPYDLRVVTVNGTLQQIGRYPNRSAANSGYLTYQSHNANISVTSTGLPVATTNWTGAQIVIRKSQYYLETDSVTNHTGNTLTYVARADSVNPIAKTPQDGLNGFGCFIQNDLRTLDIQGEWYYKKSTNELYMYSTTDPDGLNVKVGNTNKLIDLAARTGVTISGIAFEGANMSGIYSVGGNTLSVNSCTFNNMGVHAIQFWNSYSINLNHLIVTNSLSNGIQVRNSTGDNVYIGYCNVSNIALFPGMGGHYDNNDHKGIVASVDTNLVIEYCYVANTGYSAIEFGGNSVIVQYCEASFYCIITQDGAGIYTHAAGTYGSGPTYTNRTVQYCIVHDGTGAPQGTNSSSPAANGIYTDGKAMNVRSMYNTLYNITRTGITHNNPVGIEDRGNYFVNVNRAIAMTTYRWGEMGSNVVARNVFFLNGLSNVNIYYTNDSMGAKSLPTALLEIGRIDSNYYNNFNQLDFAFELYTGAGVGIAQAPYSLTTWQTNTGYDSHSTILPQIASYEIASLTGANMAANGTFNSNTTGYANMGGSSLWDNTAKISGAGSYKITFPVVLPNTYAVIHSPIGAVTAGSFYVLRFKTLGTATKGIVRGYMRKTTSPNTTYSAIFSHAYENTITQHEFLLQSTATDNASLSIGIEEGSGTTYIDDIEFYPATGHYTTIIDSVVFIKNNTLSTTLTNFPAYYIDIPGVTSSSRTVPPFNPSLNFRVGPIGLTGAEKLTSGYRRYIQL